MRTHMTTSHYWQSPLFRFLPVKRALLQYFGLATHWSTTHDGYWSVVRYCHCASPGKVHEALDMNPLLWAAEGEHPAPAECCHPPVTATAIAARKAANTQRAASRGEAEPRFTEFDLWPLVVRAGIRNTADARTAHLQLQAYAKKHCSVAVCAFLFKHRAKLPNLIDDIWAWECVEEVLEVARRSRLDALAAARCGPCVCGGEWLSFVVGAFIRNAIPMQAL